MLPTSSTTVKNDWLNDILATNGAYVSGHAEFVARLGLTGICESVEIRFLRKSNYGNYKFFFFVTVKCDADKWDAAGQALDNSQAYADLIKEWPSVFGEPIRTLFFDGKVEGKFRRFESSTNFEDLDDEKLARHFASIDKALTENPGATKAINRSTNDNFQTWGRKFLSKFLAVNDIDALFIGENSSPVIFELKRVQEDIDSWRPYLDDVSNYMSVIAIAVLAKGQLRTLSYQESIQDKVALHFIEEATKEKIKGNFLICRPDDVTKRSLGTSYISRNRRVY